MPPVRDAEPEEVPLQLADSPAAVGALMIGTSPRWVPDLPVAILAETPVIQSSPVRGLVGHDCLPSDPKPETLATLFTIPGAAADSEAALGSVIDRVKGRRKKNLVTSPWWHALFHF